MYKYTLIDVFIVFIFIRLLFYFSISFICGWVGSVTDSFGRYKNIPFHLKLKNAMFHYYSVWWICVLSNIFSFFSSIFVFIRFSICLLGGFSAHFSILFAFIHFSHFCFIFFFFILLNVRAQRIISWPNYRIVWTTDLTYIFIVVVIVFLLIDSFEITQYRERHVFRRQTVT